MSVITNNLLLGDEGYFLTKSLRFRSSASAYLNRTPTTPTNNLKWTWSGWVKRGSVSAAGGLFDAYLDGVNFSTIYFQADGTIQFYNILGGADSGFLTTPVYRDPSAWYHIVFIYDSANATAADRGIIYINGVRQTVTNPYGQIGLNEATYLNNSYASYIGRQVDSGYYFDGYMVEINFIDGQALTPSSFGETSTSTGVWIPKKYTGTYGTNGFYLPFTDVATTSGSNAGLGKDFSGNGNYWTTNNISVTSGSTYDSMKDVPTLTDTDTANYCTWNPLDKGTVTVTNGNLSAVSAADAHAIRATMGLPLSGKFYWETTVSGLGYGSSLGIASATSILTTGASSAETRTFQWGSWFNSFNSGIVQYGTNQTLTGGTNWSGASQLATNDVLMIAVDMDNGSMWVGKNGTWFNSSGTANPATNTDPRWTGLGGTTWFAYYSGYGSVSPVTANINFGQRPFAYTPPTGFKALNTFNLPTPTIGATASSQAGKYFNPVLYTGNGSSLSVTGVGFQPDLVWTKARSTTYNHSLVDAVRGISKSIQSNLTNAEDNASGSYVTAFNSDGFTVGTGTASNNNGTTYVAWNWKANGSGSSNTAGTITSTVSANTTAGFSIVTFTCPASGNFTVGHGLGVAPAMFILKTRSAVDGWYVYHQSLSTPASTYLTLNATSAAASSTSIWGNTNPTSTVLTLGTNAGIAANQTGVLYCFAQVAGYSAFGSYTGNGSTDGVFVFTGFRPRYIMIKITSTTGSWTVVDTARDPFNLATKGLYPDLSQAEDTSRTIDILSNGFKFRSSANNISGATFIYMAFAESPFKFSNAR